MTDINLKTLTPDTSLPTTGFLFGADSQASTNPSVYSTQTVATTLLGSTSLTGDTLTASAPVLDLTQTWNSVGTTFTGVRFNAAGSSSTNSAAGSMLIDLQLGGTSYFNVARNGTTTLQNTLNLINGANTPIQLNASQKALACTLDFVIKWQSSTSSLSGVDYAFFGVRTTSTAANPIFRFGGADNALPVAQTLSVQSVVAGTSNTAGAAFTINGSQGTGTGAGGSIVFQVAPAGGSGTAQNALAAALTIAGSGSVTINNANAVLDIQRSGTTRFSFYEDASITQFAVASNGRIGFSSTTTAAGFNDVALFRDAANILALKRDNFAQEFRVYETTTGPIYKALLGNRQLMKISGASFTDGAGSSAGTITNAPAVGNPTKWIPIDDNGTTRYIPAW